MIIFLSVTAWLVWSYTKYAKVNTGQTQTVLDLEVSGGTLRQNIVEGADGTVEVDMSKVFLSGGDEVTSGMINTLVKDHRGTAVGWSQTMSCTNFFSGSDIIAVNNLSVDPATITPYGESDLSGVFLGTTHNLVDENDQAVLMYALPGAGEGRYEAESILELFIDKNTPSGSYTAEVTVTVA